ncbi:MAG: hypothetical protein MUE67_13510, partial [Anaerolineales bacterium]|nr:hypothetical protein [Anaerolineales bacterium]
MVARRSDYSAEAVDAARSVLLERSRLLGEYQDSVVVVGGCDLAVSLSTEVTLSGTLPGGGKDTTTVRVATIMPFLLMKTMALAGQLMEKDAWDIYYCIRYYPSGVNQIADEFRSHLGNRLV